MPYNNIRMEVVSLDKELDFRKTYISDCREMIAKHASREFEEANKQRYATHLEIRFSGDTTKSAIQATKFYLEGLTKLKDDAKPRVVVGGRENYYTLIFPVVNISERIRNFTYYSIPTVSVLLFILNHYRGEDIENIEDLIKWFLRRMPLRGDSNTNYCTIFATWYNYCYKEFVIGTTERYHTGNYNGVYSYLRRWFSTYLSSYISFAVYFEIPLGNIGFPNKDYYILFKSVEEFMDRMADKVSVRERGY